MIIGVTTSKPKYKHLFFIQKSFVDCCLSGKTPRAAASSFDKDCIDRKLACPIRCGPCVHRKAAVFSLGCWGIALSAARRTKVTLCNMRVGARCVYWILIRSLLAEMRQGAAQRRAGDLHQPLERRVHRQNQEDRA